MRMMKKFIFLMLCLNIKTSYSQDYFNPMFLGEDTASLEDLSYLVAGNNIPPGDYSLYFYIGDELIKNLNVKFITNEDKKVEACITKDIINIIPFNQVTKDAFDFSSASLDECIDIRKYIKNFDYEVDLSKLILRLSIPQIYLDSTRSTLANESDWDNGIPFLLTNYNFNGSYSKNSNVKDFSSHYLNLSNRANIGPWRFNTNMYFSENKMGSQRQHQSNISSIYTSRNINSIKSNLVIGQNSLGSNIFDTNQYIGVTLATSNEMLPDSDRGYSPAIRGIVDSRSKLTVKQNGNIIYQTYINPGPYDISNLYSVGTSGDYEVELTSTEGVVTKYMVPYSSLPNLLRMGKYNYSVTLGQLDLNTDNNNKFFQGTLAIGIPLQSTMFIGSQISSDYLASAIGLGKDFGYMGGLSVDMIHAKSKINDNWLTGESYQILYSKSFKDTGTNVQLTGYRYSTSNYFTFSEATYRNDQVNNIYSSYRGRRKDSFQLNLSQSLNDFGQLYAWGNLSSYWGSEAKTKNIQIGWNKAISQLSNVMISASYNKNNNSGMNDDSFYLSLSMPLSRGANSSPMYLSNSLSYNSSSYNNLTSLYGSMLDSKLNYNVYQSTNKNSINNNTNLNVNYKANATSLYVGSSYSSQSKSIDYGASGGVLLHQNGVVFTQEANDTAILVEARGATGAKINRSGENITINNSGYALIPYATPYHYNDVELDPTTFANGYDIDNKILKTSPTRGAISKVTFDVRKGYNFLLYIKHKNKKIRFGTLVYNTTDKVSSIADDDGTVYLTGVKNKSKYTVKWDQNVSCDFTISYDDTLELNIINKMDVDCI